MSSKLPEEAMVESQMDQNADDDSIKREEEEEEEDADQDDSVRYVCMGSSAIRHIDDMQFETTRRKHTLSQHINRKYDFKKILQRFDDAEKEDMKMIARSMDKVSIAQIHNTRLHYRSSDP